MLEKLSFLELIAESATVKRQTKAMSRPRFVMAMVLASYIGFSRLYQLRFLQQEPMFTGIPGVLRLAPQSTFWRFLRSLHLTVAGQLLTVRTRMRQRVWDTADVQLKEVTLDTDTTVHTLSGITLVQDSFSRRIRNSHNQACATVSLAGTSLHAFPRRARQWYK